jgi:hypothetical protein
MVIRKRGACIPLLFLAACAAEKGAAPAASPAPSSTATGTTQGLSPGPLRADFPFGYTKGRAQVYSDISPDFSKEHGDHLALVYDYFARLFAKSYGGAAVAYYTEDPEVFQRILADCPSVVVAGARSLTGCYDPATGIQSLVIVPYVVPDFGTQLHEFSHQFLYATWPPSEDHPWLKEGTGMFWESGQFDASGQLVVTTPLPYLRIGIGRFRKSLLPLEQLLYLDRNEFYGHPEPVRVYSQAGMLLFYLMHKQPQAMRRAFDAINDGSVRDNAQLVSLILAESHLTLDELEQAYVAYAFEP